MRPALDRGPVVAQRRVGVGQVDHQPFDGVRERGDDLSLAVLRHVGQDSGVDLQVPGVVEFAGLKNRTGRRLRIAAALEGQRAEGGFVGVAIMRIGLKRDDVIRLEFGHPVGAGPMRVKVLVGAFRRLGAHAIRELSRLNDRALCADERAIGERLGLAEGHLDRQVVDRLNIRNVRELGELLTAARRVHAVVGGEDRVGGGEVAAVGPFNARLQFPGDRGQILADAAVLDCRNLRREPGHHLTILVVAGERFNHQRRGVHVLGAAGQERVHD